ncbi:hypothetical protein POSPLADRAFT_1074392 [Postia placenta MAD-698-R-SB12]|uniref:Poly(A) RNA polymerase mitochondrial-like central palm domain-containing protein n=1 Tax=Postia placenta MAD-698-R-SB12 TaxID=670580 RepID=A0A1X6N081_9APHY|nr:hypothetical protein POSPLADRAFT_1074392 [Postia placenta MAD-698-R-SB12]OSX62015.1 hypothetical protein POSPLADRAFT_1074392 [Postia placenta MAD-698-R-SB12]
MYVRNACRNARYASSRVEVLLCNFQRMVTFSTIAPCIDQKEAENVHQAESSLLYQPPQIPTSVLRARESTVERVAKLVQKEYGQQYSVQLFGSTRCGTDSPFSDLDIVVLDPSRPCGNSPKVTKQPLPVVYNVCLLARKLRANGYTQVLCRPSATVPIAKCTDPRTGISCDIEINDRLGIKNTELIKRYCELHPSLRAVLIVLKRWAKPLGLNNPSGEGTHRKASFSSYAFAMMSIGLYQRRGWLPNMQASVHASAPREEDLFWIQRKRLKPRGFINIPCDTRYNLCKDWAPRGPDNVCLALLEWFRYWADEHNYAADVMSVRHGGRKSRKAMLLKASGASMCAGDFGRNIALMSGGNGQRSGQQWMNPPLCVGDPFIPDKNLTVSIGHSVLQRFRAECRSAAAVLERTSSIPDLWRAHRRHI